MDLPDHRQQTMRGLAPGTRLGRYTVVRRLGSGGMAELYLGRLDGPEGFVKPVALKLMHAHLSDDAQFARMFLKEARIAAALEHPGIVQVLDVGELGGEYFMALEYVHGRDLRQVLAELRGTPMPRGAALRVVIEMGRALHYAHRLRDAGGRALGIVHRDVSPSNVLLSFQGVVKLADFGVAKMSEQTNATATGTLKGKLGYMSPEQCMQEHVDARSDVFSLGVLLYEATTSRRAFRAEQPMAVMNRVIDGQWTPPDHFVPDYPPALHEIVVKALEVHVERRYESAEALCEALERFASESGLDTRSEVLASFLQERYGQPALPDLEIPTFEVPRIHPQTVELSEESTLHGVPPEGGGSRRWGTVAALVGVLGVGGLLGWQVARTTGEETRPAPVVAPVHEAVMAAPRTEQSAAVDAQTAGAAVVDPDATPREAEPASAEVADADPHEDEAEDEAEPNEPEPSSRRSKRRRRRKTTTNDDKNETERAREILFPKSSR